MEKNAPNKTNMDIRAARNGWTIRTRSGIYICTTIDQLLTEVKSYALVLAKEAKWAPVEDGDAAEKD